MSMAIAGQILDVVDERARLALVEVAGVQRIVNVGLLDDDRGGASAGDWVLVHVGFAVSKVDSAEALATRRMLERMSESHERELEDLKGGIVG